MQVDGKREAVGERTVVERPVQAPGAVVVEGTVEVVVEVRVDRLVGLLGSLADGCEDEVGRPRGDPVAGDDGRGRQADPQMPPLVGAGPDDRPRATSGW